ncbi:MAG TPA: APC family permease [Gemmatimonadaceae bacterium]|nr:APC family permease [Gemmatimonadaceae bacterium]
MTFASGGPGDASSVAASGAADGVPPVRDHTGGVNDGRGSGADAKLVRALGVRALAATMFNVMVGAGIFLLPAVAAGMLGPAAPLAYIACAVAIALIVLCFAEAGSRVSLTGGVYAYVEIAFGRWAGFVTGVLLWMVMTAATAAVATAFAGQVVVALDAAGTAWGGVLRGVTLVVLLTLLAATNVRGIRAGAHLVELATVVKLIPLVGFSVVGAYFIHPAALSMSPLPHASGVAAAAAVVIFAFGGIESALVPSGEVRDPARTIPRALFIAMAGVTLLYIALQVVAQGILGARLAAETDAPLAAAAGLALGGWARVVLLVGAAVSMFGHQSGMMLAAPRALFAMGRDGVLPRTLAAVHPRFRTPHVAIVVQAMVVLVLAITGSFAPLATLANAALLVLYLVCCAAAWELRRRDVRMGGIPFRVPGGALIPVAAIAVTIWLLAGMPARNLVAVGAVVVAAGVVGWIRERGRVK